MHIVLSGDIRNQSFNLKSAQMLSYKEPRCFTRMWCFQLPLRDSHDISPLTHLSAPSLQTTIILIRPSTWALEKSGTTDSLFESIIVTLTSHPAACLTGTHTTEMSFPEENHSHFLLMVTETLSILPCGRVFKIYSQTPLTVVSLVQLILAALFLPVAQYQVGK